MKATLNEIKDMKGFTYDKMLSNPNPSQSRPRCEELQCFFGNKSEMKKQKGGIRIGTKTNRRGH